MFAKPSSAFVGSPRSWRAPPAARRRRGRRGCCRRRGRARSRARGRRRAGAPLPSASSATSLRVYVAWPGSRSSPLPTRIWTTQRPCWRPVTTRHREAEPLLPADVDFRAEVEREWRKEGASGVFARRRRTCSRHRSTLARRRPGCASGIAGQAIEGDREPMRDLYAAAAAALGRRRAARARRLRPVARPGARRRLVPPLASAPRRRCATARDRPTPKSRSTATSRSGAATPDDFDETARARPSR